MKKFLLIMLWGGLINFCYPMRTIIDEDGNCIKHVNIDEYEDPFTEDFYDLDREDVYDELNGSIEDDFLIGSKKSEDEVFEQPEIFSWNRLKPKRGVGYIAAKNFFGRINKKHSFKNLMLQKRIYFKSLNGEYLDFSDYDFSFRMHIFHSFFFNYRISEILFNLNDFYEKNFLKKCEVFFKKFFYDIENFNNKNALILLFESHREFISTFVESLYFLFYEKKIKTFIFKTFFYCFLKKSLATWTSTDDNALRCNKFQFYLRTSAESLELPKDIKELVVSILRTIFLTSGRSIGEEFYSINDDKIEYNSIVLI